MSSTSTTDAPRAGRRRGFLIGFLVLIVLLAGVGSYYASAHPDGLEYVASELGFEDQGEESGTAESPLADYQTKGVDNARIGGGLAGVIGVFVTLLVAGGLAFVVRRRGHE